MSLETVTALDSSYTRLPEDENLVLYEGLSVKLQSAPFFKRFMAYVIDLAIVYGTIYIIFYVTWIAAIVAMIPLAAVAGDASGALVAVLFIFAILVFAGIYHGYFIYFEYKKSATPGKRIFGLKVVSLSGKRLSLRQCVLRDLMRYVDCLLVLPGILAIVLTQKKQRLGDLACSTMVTHSKSQERTRTAQYMSLENYQYWRECLLPQPPDPQESKIFLSYAFPVLILKNRMGTEQERDYYINLARRYFRVQSGTSLPDNETLLRFFGEHCLQSQNAE